MAGDLQVLVDVGSQHDLGNVWAELPRQPQERQTVHIGHLVVRDDQGHAAVAQDLKGSGSGGRRHDCDAQPVLE